MPFHFQSITRDSEDGGLLAYLLKNGLDDTDGVLASEDKRFLHIMRIMRDAPSGDRIGKIVFTLFIDNEEKTLRILDVDITLDGGGETALTFLNKLPDSSDANEYYDVVVVEGEQHIQIETVNRHIINQELLETTHKVRASAFPFRLTVFDSMDALNESLGLKDLRVGKTDMKVGGLAPTFAAPASIIQNEDYAGEVFSFLVGTVKSVRDVSVDFGERTLAFAIVMLDSALGLLPTAMGRDVFDLSGLAPGKVIAMYADIKADFAVDQ